MLNGMDTYRVAADALFMLQNAKTVRISCSQGAVCLQGNSERAPALASAGSWGPHGRLLSRLPGWGCPSPCPCTPQRSHPPLQFPGFKRSPQKENIYQNSKKVFWNHYRSISVPFLHELSDCSLILLASYWCLVLFCAYIMFACFCSEHVREVVSTWVLLNHGLHFAATGSWSWLTEYLLEVTGTLPSVSPLQKHQWHLAEHTTSHPHSSISNPSRCISETTEASESCCPYLYTQTLMLLFRSSVMIGKTVVALSVQRLKTSLKKDLSYFRKI